LRSERACGRNAQIVIEEKMAADVTFPAAAAAGVLSFLSPCVLPLVPPYLTYLAGVSIEDLEIETRSEARRDITRSGNPLCLWFFHGVCRLRRNRERLWFAYSQQSSPSILAGRRRHYSDGPAFYWLIEGCSSFIGKNALKSQNQWVSGCNVMGLAFAFGWTPCIGPISAAILRRCERPRYSNARRSIARHLFAWPRPSLYHRRPSARPFPEFCRRASASISAKSEKLVGFMLILTGIAFLTGGIQEMSFWLLELFPSLGSLGLTGPRGPSITVMRQLIV